MAGERVLIVEDESVVQLHLRQTLESLRYTVVGLARTAAAALASAAAAPPDLVLMDIHLPGGQDGVEAARELRSRYDLPIVFLTAYADEPTVERVRAVEAAGYIVKPFTRDELRAVLATALTQHRARRQVEQSHSDLLAILSELGVGSAILAEDGAVSFLSPSAARLLGIEPAEVLYRPWRQALPFDGDTAGRLAELCRQPPAERSRLAAHLEPRGRRRRWMEIEVRDDPRQPAQRILFFYDTTEVHELRRQLGEASRFHHLIGSSPAMTRVFEEIRQVARVDWTVLIEGETGTGKELVARAIHAESPRANRRFVAVNGAGLTESLLASQLFGHLRGAFTGAVNDQEGLFAAAAGGTLFLDEVGDLAPGIQTALLRVLEDKEVTRLGETRPRKVDVRLLLATHRHLAEEVQKGAFRADLLYRIRVARIELPPLCRRPEDIPLLATWFLGRSAAAAGKPVDRLSGEALRRLLEHDWPGNVRELKSAVEHAVLRCRGETIEADDLPPEVTAGPLGQGAGSGAGSAPEDERARILDALERAGGNRSRAARLLGVSRATLYRRLADLDLPPELPLSK